MPLSEQIPDQSAPPDAHVHSREVSETVHQALAKLSPELRAGLEKYSHCRFARDQLAGFFFRWVAAVAELVGHCAGTDPALGGAGRAHEVSSRACFPVAAVAC